VQVATRSARADPAPGRSAGSAGTLVAFATEPGNVSLDGDNSANSPFTTALLNHLATPGVEIGVVLRRVREAVLTSTQGKQVPWENSSLIGEVMLVPPVAAAPAPAAPDRTKRLGKSVTIF
jgi:uncharacterized caspase-like protein